MQELLGRISRLDPEASLGLRVIACFDELVVGNVNTRALLSAAASLSGCNAGFSQDQPARSMRVTPRGELARDDGGHRLSAPASSGLIVWLEREGSPHANDAIVLERLALAMRIRHGRGRSQSDNRRDLGLLLDQSVPLEGRCTAAAALGLTSRSSYRVAAAPLFAVWKAHPGGPEDVVPTRFGPIHALVLTAESDMVEASPCGVGVATTIEHLHHSFRTALVAVRLCAPPDVPSLSADRYAGLVDLLADQPTDAHQPDIELIDRIARHTWGVATVDAIVRSGSVRQAARLAELHHSTMQARVDTVTTDLGFDPFDGFGRARIGLAYLAWRLKRSRVLDLPAPAQQA